MNIKLSVVVIMVVMLAAVAVGDVTQTHACDRAKIAALSTAKADGADVWVTAALATLPADAGACCKATVANSVAACYEACYATKTAAVSSGYSGCTKSAAVQTAGASACTKSATKTAGADGCLPSMLAALPAGTGDCCKQAVTTAYNAYVANCTKSTTTTASTQLAVVRPASSASCYAAKTAATTTAGSYSCTKASATKVVYATIDVREGKRVELTVNWECSKCALKISDKCSTLFQTADGKFYRILDNNLVKDMRKSVKSDKDLKIVTRVRKVDGVKYLELDAFEVVKS